MKIGDRVKLDYDNTLYGYIIDKIIPSCKCKGKGEWLIKFDGINGHKKVRINDPRLTIAESIEIKRFDYTHKML